jgi:hypothetical protein
LETAETAIACLRDQRASAYILKGAIASARAADARSEPLSAELDKTALDDFRLALQVPGKHQVEAKEYEAHQLRKLGNQREAERAYTELEALANSMSDGQARDLVRARARRWLASIAQAQAWEEYKKGIKPRAASKHANRLMTGERSASSDADGNGRIDPAAALPLRALYGRPFQNWDAIEQGEMHYLSAFIYHNLGWGRKERRQLDAAETSYQSILSQTPPSRWFAVGSTKRLRLAARAGLDRVNRAQSNSDYDRVWLLPRSKDSQRPPSPIGQPGGDQGIQETS